MLMALRFEPSRFFLKGKVTQKQTSYKHLTVREEVSHGVKWTQKKKIQKAESGSGPVTTQRRLNNE